MKSICFSRTVPATRLPAPPGRHRLLAATFVVALAGIPVLLSAPNASAAQGPVGLGTADSFAVLAGSGITNTGPTTITGDVGAFPTPSETGFASVTLHGTNHEGDAVTQGAKDDLVVAYVDAAGRKPVTNVPTELGGTTKFAGVYSSPTLGLTGTLTLDAEGNPDAQFIFKAGSTLITATDSRVLLVNGANPCHVVWQVGSSATFDTRTQFVGDVLAHTSITAVTAATFEGRLLARNGAVTLDTNTITNADCAAPSDGGGGATTSTTGGSGGTTSTTGGSTATVPGTSMTPPPPGEVRLPGGPRSPGTPRRGATPPVATPGTPIAAPPSLATTGANTGRLLLTGFGFVGVGVATLVAARQMRRRVPA